MIDEWMKLAPYALSQPDKERLLTERLLDLSRRHAAGCPEYAAMIRAAGFDPQTAAVPEPSAGANRAEPGWARIPFLPVRLFKELELRSVPREEIVKTMTSSGTTGQAVSRILLDRATAAAQQKALVRIVSDFTGSARMPMLIIDSPSVIRDRTMFSARGAGILGFSIFGSDKLYALDDDMRLDLPAVRNFLGKHRGEPILIFGFTFMVWLHFYEELLRLRGGTAPGDGAPAPEALDLSRAVLIHGGGWKKLAADAVSKSEFKRRLHDLCGITRVHDYYGMVEQTGCIYMECERGHLHASVFSDVVMRRPADFSVCDIGEPGIIQVVSALPESYPGHSLLTEDEGVVLGVDDCPCGRKGKYFEVLGRLRAAEIRGCSDTYAADRVGRAAAGGRELPSNGDGGDHADDR